MKRRKENLLQKIMAVVLSGVLITGMMSEAAASDGTDHALQDEVSKGRAETVEKKAAGILPADVYAAEDRLAFGRDWTLAGDGTLTVFSDAGMIGWKQDGWELYKNEVTRIVVSDGVTKIPETAFMDCTRAGAVTLSDTVREIGTGAFWVCSGIREIILPAEVECVREYAFAYCAHLEKVTVQSQTPPSLGERVFENCPFIRDHRKAIRVPSAVVEQYREAWTAYGEFIADVIITDVRQPEEKKEDLSCRLPDCAESETIRRAPLELYATRAMIAGFAYLLSYIRA